ncbi:unnamed protein product [Calypogeia fissa]
MDLDDDVSLSDAERLAISQGFWELEEDVVFSPGLDSDLVPDSPSGGLIRGQILSDPGPSNWVAWSSLSLAPCQLFGVDFHLQAPEFLRRFIVDQVLSSFSPGLIWLPLFVMVEGCLSFFEPILRSSLDCPLCCFSCQLWWTRCLLWFKW